MAITVKNKEKHKDIMLKVCKKNVYSFLHYIQVHLTKVLFNDQMSNTCLVLAGLNPTVKAFTNRNMNKKLSKLTNLKNLQTESNLLFFCFYFFLS